MNTNKWRVMPAIIATAILSFCGVLIETSMNVTFPTLMTEFNVKATSIQWVTTGNLLAVAAIVPLSAYLIKNFSEKFIFTLANAFFIAGVIIDSFAPSLFILLIGRISQGIGTGIALPLLYHIILEKIPFEKRGLVMGVATMTTSLAPALGPTYGGLVLASLGWKMIFSLLLPLLIVSTLVGLSSIPNKHIQKTTSLNVSAFIFLGIGLSSLLLAIEKLSFVWLILSLSSLVIFYFLNKRKVLLNLHVFKNNPYLILLIAVLIFQMVPLALSFVLPNHIQLVLEKTSTQAGLFMFPGSILVAILAPLSGILLDKIGPFKPIMIGLGIILFGLVGMSLLFPYAPFFILLLCDITVKLGMGLSGSNLISSTLTKLDKHEATDGNSILNTLQQFSGAFATAVASQIFSLGQNSELKNGAAIGGRNAVIFLVIMVILAISCVLYLKKEKEL